MDWTFRPIGTIRSPFVKQEGTPIQPCFAHDARGEIILDETFAPALKDLEGFERIWVLHVLDRSTSWEPLVKPYLDDVKRGVFAVRSPARPNPIGLSCLRLVGIEGSILFVAELDILDGTPVLDIKPYVPRFDCYPNVRAGWLDQTNSRAFKADGRFEKKPGNGEDG
ncbi:MAG: tRNA (N6-threonylcarbamoyladenosine(37)-N6)-methyltransferase TrmO [Myxococcales bacterium]|nr:MAG: tRNA (N6-threonylcarbamoyladenosine(37)-N6)-methyltransferase TrmO [Myxococcales bacterium]